MGRSLQWARSAAFAALLLSACGGGGGGSSTPAPTPVPPAIALTQVSAASTFAAGCNGQAQSGTLYVDGPVEPVVAVNPANAQNLIGVWQQDRWSTGGAQALMTGVSTDGGHTWSRQALPFAHCSGGTAANGGDYDRASDPWVTFSPNGVAYQIAIAFSGDLLKAGSSGAVLVSRSSDGGATWAAPTVLISDGAAAFNDKEAITADPTDPNYVYAVWDRLTATDLGPTWLARSSDGGLSWPAAQAIYDPGQGNQTIGNQIAVLPNGTLALFFTELDQTGSGSMAGHFAVMHSTDHGSTWAAPVKLADSLGVGAKDPRTGTPVRDGTGLLSAAVGPDGRLAAAWQDARFSNGSHDGIAFSQSGDGGTTWSAPVQINGAPAVQAFTPTVHIGADGSIGVSYFDFRDDGSNPGALLTDYWLTVSRDGGATWSEQRIDGPFSLLPAPYADGHFLGDYQALAALPSAFLLFFAQADNGGGDHSRIFAGQVPYAGTAQAGAAIKALAVPAQFQMTPEFAARVSDAIKRNLREQVPPRRARAKALAKRR